MTYDTWKTTDPADNEPGGECDCCGKRGRLNYVFAHGMDTWACAACRGSEPDEDDQDDAED